MMRFYAINALKKIPITLLNRVCTSDRPNQSVSCQEVAIRTKEYQFLPTALPSQYSQYHISLFAAVTSLLMFLSILTARFAEQYFLFKLRTKLIIGLTTLFISTTAMILALAQLCSWYYSYSHSCVDLPTNYFVCDLAVPSRPRLD